MHFLKNEQVQNIPRLILSGNKDIYVINLCVYKHLDFLKSLFVPLLRNDDGNTCTPCVWFISS